MLKPIIQTSGEINLLCDDTSRFIQLNALEEWQINDLEYNCPQFKDNSQIHCNLSLIDKIADQWFENLSVADIARIKTSSSLYGIEIPKDWIKMWRIILKEPELRGQYSIIKKGTHIGSYFHIWTIWTQNCIETYLDEIDKNLLQLVDLGLPYKEIGVIMLNQYGDNFWKKRKEKNNSTTPEQIVNNYLYSKLPTKIARKDLYNYAKKRIAIEGV